jgi:hypothetical protein
MFAYLFAMVLYLIKKLFYLLEFFLFLRLILKFLEANPNTLVVKLIYKWSYYFVSPFNFIFKNIYWPQGYFIETATISAMAGYAILAFIVFKMLQPLSKD